LIQKTWFVVVSVLISTVWFSYSSSSSSLSSS
jgi:hypothetical protein